ncbi:MAG: carbonic anhydrase [Myxococcales bacterium]|nr:carbonic anhydrase [Myxococcales bacterium]
MSRDSYRRVFEANRRWVAERTAADPHFFEHLARGQSPEFLYIGCADSRVPANEIMGVHPGEVFVHRNVANLVVNTDLNAQSCIEYAVTHLGVQHIVVCGHYGCGGVAAAMQPADLGTLNGWLREVRDVYRLHAAELDAIADEQARYRRLVELNVQEQAINVIKVACVQQRYRREGFPHVHGWVYDLANGLLVDLEIPFEEVLERISEIYRLG